jgi:hypothetical protein
VIKLEDKTYVSVSIIVDFLVGFSPNGFSMKQNFATIFVRAIKSSKKMKEGGLTTAT